MEDCSILRWMFITWNYSPKQWDTIYVVPINMTYFLLVVDLLFYLNYFHNADVYIFAKTTALFNNIFIHRTNSSFSTWNLRSIGPSGFKFRMFKTISKISYEKSFDSNFKYAEKNYSYSQIIFVKYNNYSPSQFNQVRCIAISWLQFQVQLIHRRVWPCIFHGLCMQKSMSRSKY